jgi:hypothetical protein
MLSILIKLYGKSYLSTLNYDFENKKGVTEQTTKIKLCLL